VLLLALVGLPGGLSLAAVLLMLLGTQWYILFNVIAGAMAIPSDLREATTVYHASGWRKWRTLILPGIFPYLVTGLLTASGGATVGPTGARSNPNALADSTSSHNTLEFGRNAGVPDGLRAAETAFVHLCLSKMATVDITLLCEGKKTAYSL